MDHNKPKPYMSPMYTFSRAMCRLHVLGSSFDWFIGFLQFGVDFSTLN